MSKPDISGQSSIIWRHLLEPGAGCASLVAGLAAAACRHAARVARRTGGAAHSGCACDCPGFPARAPLRLSSTAEISPPLARAGCCAGGSLDGSCRCQLISPPPRGLRGSPPWGDTGTDNAARRQTSTQMQVSHSPLARSPSHQCMPALLRMPAFTVCTPRLSQVRPSACEHGRAREGYGRLYVLAPRSTRQHASKHRPALHRTAQDSAGQHRTAQDSTGRHGEAWGGTEERRAQKSAEEQPLALAVLEPGRGVVREREGGCL